MTVYESGSYSVSVVDYFGCKGSDEVFVTIKPEAELPNDTSVCEGDTIIINLNDDFDFIYWNDGSSWKSLSVTGGGIYWVDVDFNIGCPSSDTISVEPFLVEVRVVITPNGDGYNDRFMPKKSWHGINSSKMTIYNRWGGKVWETNDFPSGWDGKQNGSYVADGTYFWVLEITYGPEDLSWRSQYAAHKASLKSERARAHGFHEFTQIKVDGYGKEAGME